MTHRYDTVVTLWLRPFSTRDENPSNVRSPVPDRYTESEDLDGHPRTLIPWTCTGSRPRQLRGWGRETSYRSTVGVRIGTPPPTVCPVLESCLHTVSQWGPFHRVSPKIFQWRNSFDSSIPLASVPTRREFCEEERDDTYRRSYWTDPNDLSKFHTKDGDTHTTHVESDPRNSCPGYRATDGPQTVSRSECLSEDSVCSLQRSEDRSYTLRDIISHHQSK